MTERIKVTGLEKSYAGDGVITEALRSVDVTLNKKQFSAIVGPSGSGKSTLLSLIGTLDKPTGGNIYYNEQDINKLKGKELADFRFQNIGFIFQQFHLIPTLTALENVMAPLFSRRTDYNKTERAKEVLELVGLSDKLNSLPSQLSGGEQQRVAVARAVVNNPDWLLADEPTGNLDTKNGEIVFNLLHKLNQEQECGVVLVTHDLNLASKTDRIIEIEDGKIIKDTEIVNTLK